MIPLSEVGKLRRKYNLTQKELANLSNVSQSLIAKIEAGTIDPTYSNGQRIIQTLQELKEKNEPKAADIMNKNIVFASTSDSLKKIIQIMKTKGISQIPVLSDKNVIGTITEGTLLNEIIENPQKLSSKKVLDIMEESPAIVSETTSVRIVSQLLRSNHVVLVATKGEVKGIISKADLLQTIS